MIETKQNWSDLKAYAAALFRGKKTIGVKIGTSLKAENNFTGAVLEKHSEINSLK